MKHKTVPERTAACKSIKEPDPIKDLANALFHDEDLGSNNNSLRSENDSEANENRLAEEIDFSGSESDDGMEQLQKNHEQYQQFKSMNKKLTSKTQKAYFDAVAKNAPDLERG